MHKVYIVRCYAMFLGKLTIFMFEFHKVKALHVVVIEKVANYDFSKNSTYYFKNLNWNINFWAELSCKLILINVTVIFGLRPFHQPVSIPLKVQLKTILVDFSGKFSKLIFQCYDMIYKEEREVENHNEKKYS